MYKEAESSELDIFAKLPEEEANFLRTSYETLLKKRNSLNAPIEVKKSHNRRRGKREIHDIRDQRIKMFNRTNALIDDVNRAIDIIKSGDIDQIKFRRDNATGQILGFEIKNQED